MLLAIDVGNTHTVLGVWDDTRLAAHWRVGTRSERTSDEMSVLIQSLFNTSEALSTRDISAAIVSSVVPSLTRIMVGMAIGVHQARSWRLQVENVFLPSQ